jgi:hypothetical protein
VRKRKDHTFPFTQSVSIHCVPSLPHHHLLMYDPQYCDKKNFRKSRKKQIALNSWHSSRLLYFCRMNILCLFMFNIWLLYQINVQLKFYPFLFICIHSLFLPIGFLIIREDKGLQWRILLARSWFRWKRSRMRD